MPVVSISVNTIAPGVVNKLAAPKRVRLSQTIVDGLSLSFPYGPRAVQFDKLGSSYSEVSRPGLKPLLISSNPQLRTVTFNAVIADKSTGGKVPIQGMLNTLETMATDDIDCEFTYGLVALPYRVRITKISYKSIWRDLDGNLIQADLSIQLTEHVTLDQRITQLKAITVTPVADPVKPAVTAPTPSLPPDKLVITCTLPAFSDHCDAVRAQAEYAYTNRLRYWNNAHPSGS